MTSDILSIRLAGPADVAALTRLALLDGATALRGSVLVAESGGELRAAWSLDERRGIADPFVPTAADLALLRTRAKQLQGDGRRPRRRARIGRVAPAH